MHRHDARREWVYIPSSTCNFDLAPDAPDTQPMADASKESAQIMADLGREQMAEGRRQYDQNAAMAKPIIEAQTATMRQGMEQGNDYYSYLKSFRPAELAIMGEAYGLTPDEIGSYMNARSGAEQTATTTKAASKAEYDAAVQRAQNEARAKFDTWQREQFSAEQQAGAAGTPTEDKLPPDVYTAEQMRSGAFRGIKAGLGEFQDGMLYRATEQSDYGPQVQLAGVDQRGQRPSAALQSNVQPAGDDQPMRTTIGVAKPTAKTWEDFYTAPEQAAGLDGAPDYSGADKGLSDAIVTAGNRAAADKAAREQLSADERAALAASGKKVAADMMGDYNATLDANLAALNAARVSSGRNVGGLADAMASKWETSQAKIDEQAKLDQASRDQLALGNTALYKQNQADVDAEVGTAVSDARTGYTQSLSQAAREGMRLGLSPEAIAARAGSLGTVQASNLASTANNSRRTAIDDVRGRISGVRAMRQSDFDRWKASRAENYGREANALQFHQGDANRELDASKANAGLAMAGTQLRTDALAGRTAARNMDYGVDLAGRDMRLQDEAIGTQRAAQDWAKKLDATGLAKGMTGASQGAYGLAVGSGNAAVNNNMAPGQQYLSNMAQGAATIGQGRQLLQSGLGSVLNAQTAAGDNSGMMGALGTMGGAAISAIPWSDKNVKKRIREPKIEDAEILREVKRLPVKAWEYDGEKIEGQDDRTHIGPMAQDMRKAFGDEVAPGGKMIDITSGLGIVLKATKALTKKVDRLEKRIGRRA